MSPAAFRELQAAEITAAVRKMAAEVPYHLGEKELKAIKAARAAEQSELGRAALDDIIRNAQLADKGEFPICQDTGLAVLFVDWGQYVHLVGTTLQEAVDEGVRLSQKEAYTRSSVMADPFDRVNTGDNTPAIVHLHMVKGDKVRIRYATKGGGSENMSRLAMLRPADGVEGLIEFAVRAVREASANPCPPIVVGLAAGGNFERVAETAKLALLRPLGQPNPRPELAEIEQRILDLVNKTGVGPAGMGGTVTALAVHLEVRPCHLASLPVAINIDCHAHRHAEIEL